MHENAIDSAMWRLTVLALYEQADSHHLGSANLP